MALFEEKTTLPRELTDKAEEIVDRICLIYKNWHKVNGNRPGINRDNELVLQFKDEFITTKIEGGFIVLKTMSPSNPTSPDFDFNKWIWFDGKRKVSLNEYLMMKIHGEEDLWELKKCAFKLI